MSWIIFIVVGAAVLSVPIGGAMTFRHDWVNVLVSPVIVFFFSWLLVVMMQGGQAPLTFPLSASLGTALPVALGIAAVKRVVQIQRRKDQEHEDAEQRKLMESGGGDSRP